MSQDQKMKRMTKKKSKLKSPKVGKYVFPNKTMALDYINKAQSTSNLYAKLGLREQGFLVDVLWNEEESELWQDFKVSVIGQGIHQFKGFKYANS